MSNQERMSFEINANVEKLFGCSHYSTYSEAKLEILYKMMSTYCLAVESVQLKEKKTSAIG
jgi:hypothetical protein